MSSPRKAGKPLNLKMWLLNLLQGEAKGGAQTNGAAHIDGLIVGFDDVFYNRQTESGAANIARTATVDAVEALK